MKASQFFISTLKEAPADAEVVSHQLMTRAGMIKKLGAGIYTLMPMGLRVVRKIEAIAKRIAKENLDVQLEVDGGIDPETARQAVDAGATALVAGTAVFKGGPASYAANIKALRGAG